MTRGGPDPPVPWPPGEFSPDELALLVRAAGWAEPPRLEDLTRERLRELVRQHGVAFATAVLFDRLVRSPVHGPFIARVEALRRVMPHHRPPLHWTVAIAPGAYYEQFPTSGADGRRVTELGSELGCRAVLIRTRSVGGVRDNAAILLDWLADRPRGEPIVLVSLSKGGADVKVALSMPGAAAAFAPVRAWFNFCGLTAGTPLVSPFLESPLLSAYARAVFFLRRHDFRLVRELSPAPGGVLDVPLRPPAHLRIVSVMGFPLAHHLSTRLMRKLHRRLAPLGPNDGSALLADALAMPGLLFPVWGADHYLRPAWGIEALAAALLTDLAAGSWTAAARP